ncbi:MULTISPECIES: GGDEF domain-containing protein [Methylosinus]|nr:MULTISPECIES: sensor domain-containing diguanylate cyclase [Methylosinus]
MARQARLLFLLSIALNTLFLASDWRFFGTPHFYVAVPARCAVILVAIVAYFGSRRCVRFETLERWLICWQALTALGVGALVTSRSDIALFVVIMLPSIYYLVVPTAFVWTAMGGVGCSAVMLLGYTLPGGSETALGMALAMIMLNSALMLVVTNSNRLRRMEWSAIGSERLARSRLADSQKMLEAVFAALPAPLIVGDLADGRVLRANQAALDCFGGEAVLERMNLSDLHMETADRAQFRRLLETERRVSGFEASVGAPDGVRRDLLISAAPIEDGGVSGVVICGVDISERKAVEARLHRLATTDALTGVANRSHFFARADAEIRRAARYRRPLSVLMVDLDHFKRVNDEHGHAVGDAVLAEFAGLCARMLRAEDLVARYGGEEFVALLPETDEQGAVAVGHRLREGAMQIRTPSAGSALRLTVSIGVSAVLAGEAAIEAALARADEALYQAKAAGRDRVVAAAIAADGEAA